MANEFKIKNGAIISGSITGVTEPTQENSTKMASTAWVVLQNYLKTIPAATASVIGGIKIGSGLAIDENGVLTIPGAAEGTLRTKQQFTATAGQTSFTITGGYTAGLIDIYLNGVLLTGASVTASNGTTVVLTDAAEAGDILDVTMFSVLNTGFVSGTTDNLSEGTTNLYYTNTRSRAAISLTTTGTSGAATYNSTTGAINIPQYQAVLTNPVTGTGTVNDLVKFTAAGVIGDSNIIDTGTLITLGSNSYVNGGLGIGTSTFTDAFTINVAAGLSRGITFKENDTTLYGARIYYNESTDRLLINMINNTSEVSGISMARGTGNITVNGTTDAGFKLDVNGTVRIQNQLTTSGSITATTGFARGVLFNNTLVASANNDVLVGLDIAPTFTNGAFTGLTNASLRVSGHIIGTAAGATSLGTGAVPFGSGTFQGILYAGTFQGYSGGFNFNVGGTNIGRFHTTTGNLTLQNGGTFTDIPSAQLQVNSTTKGFLPPRMTAAERTAISSPATGLVVFQTDGTEGLYIKTASAWRALAMV